MDGTAMMPGHPGSLKIMKTEYEKVMLEAVKSKLAKAQELGIKASWTTQDHLRTVALVIAAQIPHSGKTDADSEHLPAIFDALSETYNVSAFQQKLAKVFEKSGHFQREGRKSVAQEADELVKMALAASTPSEAPQG